MHFTKKRGEINISFVFGIIKWNMFIENYPIEVVAKPLHSRREIKWIECLPFTVWIWFHLDDTAFRTCVYVCIFLSLLRAYTTRSCILHSVYSRAHIFSSYWIAHFYSGWCFHLPFSPYSFCRNMIFRSAVEVVVLCAACVYVADVDNSFLLQNFVRIFCFNFERIYVEGKWRGKTHTVTSAYGRKTLPITKSAKERDILIPTDERFAKRLRRYIHTCNRRGVSKNVCSIVFVCSGKHLIANTNTQTSIRLLVSAHAIREIAVLKSEWDAHDMMVWLVYFDMLAGWLEGTAVSKRTNEKSVNFSNRAYATTSQNISSILGERVAVVVAVTTFARM